MCNLTWWTITEERQRDIPMQKVSAVSHRSTHGKSLNIFLESNPDLTAGRLSWLSNFLFLLCVCVCVSGDYAVSEPTRRVICGQGAGLCIAACSEQAPAPKVPSIRESVFWSRFCCANALLLVSVNIFLYAYFA